MSETIVVIILMFLYKLYDLYWYGKIDNKLNKIIEKQKES